MNTQCEDESVFENRSQQKAAEVQCSEAAPISEKCSNEGTSTKTGDLNKLPTEISELSHQLVSLVGRLAAENDLWSDQEKSQLLKRIFEIHSEEVAKLCSESNEASAGDERKQVMLKLQSDADIQLLKTVNCRRLMPDKCCYQLARQLTHQFNYYKRLVKAARPSYRSGLSQCSLISKQEARQTREQMKQWKISLQLLLTETDELMEMKKVIKSAEKDLLPGTKKNKNKAEVMELATEQEQIEVDQHLGCLKPNDNLSDIINCRVALIDNKLMANSAMDHSAMDQNPGYSL